LAPTSQMEHDMPDITLYREDISDLVNCLIHFKRLAETAPALTKMERAYAEKTDRLADLLTARLWEDLHPARTSTAITIQAQVNAIEDRSISITEIFEMAIPVRIAYYSHAIEFVYADKSRYEIALAFDEDMEEIEALDARLDAAYAD
jgi:hypothetical protein